MVVFEFQSRFKLPRFEAFAIDGDIKVILLNDRSMVYPFQLPMPSGIVEIKFPFRSM
jgi:hypothetical protein